MLTFLFFLIIFAEKYLGLFSVANIWQRMTTKKVGKVRPNFVVKNVTIRHHEKTNTIDIYPHQNTPKQRIWQRMTTKKSQKNIHVPIVQKNLMIDLDYGGITKNVLYLNRTRFWIQIKTKTTLQRKNSLWF